MDIQDNSTSRDRRTVLMLDPLPDWVVAALLERFQLLDGTADGGAEAIRWHGGSISAVVNRGKSHVGGEMMDRLRGLRLIASHGVGYDKIDAAAAAVRGIAVTNTPGVLDDDVADLAIALLLSTIRNIPSADRFVRTGEWRAGSFPLTRTLRERHVGIVGLGRIGSAIARRLEGFGVSVSYHSRRPAENSYTHFPDLEALAEAVDTMVVIVPGGPGTVNLIDARIIKALGPDGVLINVSRGAVVDQDALIEALSNGTIAAAGLDVFAQEPSVPDALCRLPNTVLTPHIGSGTHHTRRLMGQLVIENLIAWDEGGTPPSLVPETPAFTKTTTKV